MPAKIIATVGFVRLRRLTRYAAKTATRPKKKDVAEMAKYPAPHKIARAEPGAGASAQDIRRDHRVPEHALVGDTGQRQRSADEGRRGDPGQADFKQNILRPDWPARLDRLELGAE